MSRFFDKFSQGRIFLLAGLGLFMVAQTAIAGENPPPPSGELTAAGESQTADDPLESINRFTSSFNFMVRGVVIDPLVNGYQAITPAPVQEAVSNAVSNISEPLTIGSSLLQGDAENTSTAAKRFIINTTIGLGGTQDPATEMGLEQRKEDLGQAFGSGGMNPGPHIVLPIIGPSNLRDVAGDVITAIVNPLPLAAKAASGGVSYSNNQDDIKSLSAGALDPYVVERDSYEQNRRYEVNNGVVPLMDFPQFAEDEEEKKNTR
ncbi:MAG: VacJ family lipoprotein [Rhodospirillales bacterium]|nr:VacJ family lipoprotein [Rhodospirillales bacterium]